MSEKNLKNKAISHFLIIHFPEGHFPDGNFPEGHFPDRKQFGLTLSQRTFPRPDTFPMDTSPTNISPTEISPTSDIPNRHLPNQIYRGQALSLPDTFSSIPYSIVTYFQFLFRYLVNFVDIT